MDFYGEDGGLLGKFCGADIPRPIFSKRGDKLLKISFRSNEWATGRGYHIYYEASPDLGKCNTYILKLCIKNPEERHGISLGIISV